MAKRSAVTSVVENSRGVNQPGLKPAMNGQAQSAGL